jgi:hypothetical protein
MESMEDRTMKLSGLPPFPQSLEIAKERRFPHSHRTTTTDISTLQRYGHLNFAGTGICTRNHLTNGRQENRQWRPGGGLEVEVLLMVLFRPDIEA